MKSTPTQTGNIGAVFNVKYAEEPDVLKFRVHRPKGNIAPTSQYRLSGFKDLTDVTHLGLNDAGVTLDGTFPEVSSWDSNEQSKLYGIIDNRLVEIKELQPPKAVSSQSSLQIESKVGLELRHIVKAESRIDVQGIYYKAHSKKQIQALSSVHIASKMAANYRLSVSGESNVGLEAQFAIQPRNSASAASDVHVYAEMGLRRPPGKAVKAQASLSVSAQASYSIRVVSEAKSHISVEGYWYEIPVKTDSVQSTGHLHVDAWGETTPRRAVSSSAQLFLESLGDAGISYFPTPQSRSSVCVSSWYHEREPTVAEHDGRKHVVLFPSTTAMTTYDNLKFESMVQLPDGRIFAAGDGGIYEFTAGDTDDGLPIQAVMGLGYTDFKSTLMKRGDAVLIGYTAKEPLTVDLETENINLDYRLCQQPENWPKTGRIIPARGQIGRFWRMKIKNNEGSDFSISGIQIGLMSGKRSI